LIFLFCFVFLSISARLAPLLVSHSDIDSQYIVVFKKDISLDIFENQINNARTVYGEKLRHVYRHALKGFSAHLIQTELLQLRKNPFVDFIEGDQIVQAAACSTQPSGSWGQIRISQENVDLTKNYAASDKGGDGVVAYILDTGIMLGHTEFQGRAKFGFKAENQWSETDKNGHGTHVASTVGGKLYGVAKKIDLIAVKVLDDNGSGSWSGVIAGLDYVVVEYQTNKKPSVSNLSLSGGKTTAVNIAVNNAVDQGVVVVVAAGNSNTNACNYSPSSAENAIVVGATDIGTNSNQVQVDIRSFFSNNGNCVDLFAPGSDIIAAGITSTDATAVMSGTSMASPHVCGVAALMLGEMPNLPPDEVKKQLVGDATFGKIDLLCRLNQVCESSPNRLLFTGCLSS